MYGGIEDNPGQRVAPISDIWQLTVGTSKCVLKFQIGASSGLLCWKMLTHMKLQGISGLNHNQNLNWIELAYFNDLI